MYFQLLAHLRRSHFIKGLVNTNIFLDSFLAHPLTMVTVILFYLFYACLYAVFVTNTLRRRRLVSGLIGYSCVAFSLPLLVPFQYYIYCEGRFPSVLPHPLNVRYMNQSSRPTVHYTQLEHACCIARARHCTRCRVCRVGELAVSHTTPTRHFNNITFPLQFQESITFHNIHPLQPR